MGFIQNANEVLNSYICFKYFKLSLSLRGISSHIHVLYRTHISVFI